MKEKILEINQILKNKKIKAIKLENINIANLIFSLRNVDKHYITTNNKTTWYCYEMYEKGSPKNENDIIDYCNIKNLHRSLHDNDYNKRVTLEYGTAESINLLFNYLNT